MTARLGRDQRLALEVSAKDGASRIAIPGDLAKEWELFWKEQYGIKADLASLLIPRMPLCYKARLVVMHEKASQSPEFLYQSDMEAYGKVWRFTDGNLDEVAPLHPPVAHLLSGTFGFWVKDEQEAPDGCVGGINLNTAAVDELGWITESLPMRQVHGRKHYCEQKVHLDQKVWTVCTGSRLADGRVPCVYFYPSSGAVDVDARGPQCVGGPFRFRLAVL